MFAVSKCLTRWSDPTLRLISSSYKTFRHKTNLSFQFSLKKLSSKLFPRRFVVCEKELVFSSRNSNLFNTESGLFILLQPSSHNSFLSTSNHHLKFRLWKLHLESRPCPGLLYFSKSVFHNPNCIQHAGLANPNPEIYFFIAAAISSQSKSPFPIQSSRNRVQSEGC